MTDTGKRKLKNVKDCPNVYNTNKYIHKKHNATSLSLYSALQHPLLLSTATPVASKMTNVLLVITEKHKLKTNYTPVTKCKHISPDPHWVIPPAQHPELKTQESTDT